MSTHENHWHMKKLDPESFNRGGMLSRGEPSKLHTKKTATFNKGNCVQG